MFIFEDIINIEKIYMSKENNYEQDIKCNKIKQGFLIKRSRILKEWKKRWMVLTRTHLYSFENKGVYRSPTEKIPLRQVSSIKSYYKNQYERPQVFRIESDDTFFYLSANDNQEKWAWMTSIQKMTELIRNPSALDSQNLVRQSLRMSNALRQSSLTRKSFVSTKSSQGNYENVMKKMRLKTINRVIDMHFQLKNTQKHRLEVNKLQSVNIKAQYVKSQNQANPTQTEAKVIERIVQKIVQVKIPITVEKIVEKIVYIETEKYVKSQTSKQNGDSLSGLFAALIHSKLDDPYPLLDFVAFLGLTGIDHYQNIAIKFCCEQDSHRFFAELILQALNEQISQTRLNRYSGFIYILCERQPDYFYASDLKILVEIILRELQLFRSDLNQMINLKVIKTLVTYHQNLLVHKKQDIKSIASQIANLGPTQNRQISTEICLLLD